jgi:hypothetical protein
MPVETNGDLGCSARRAYSEPAAQAADASRTAVAPSHLKQDIPNEDQGANKYACSKEAKNEPCSHNQ